MMRLNVLYDGRRVGQLLEREGRHFFEYDVTFIRDPVPLSPIHLPIRRGVFEHRDGAFLGLPGLFYDSLPDRFGMAVIRRHFAERGANAPGPLHILSYLGRRTMGALSYEPAEGDADQNQAVAFVEAARSARHLLAHEHDDALDPAILASGATAGGATPKILVAMNENASKIVTGADRIPDGMQPWLVKLDTVGAAETSKCRLEFPATIYDAWPKPTPCPKTNSRPRSKSSRKPSRTGRATQKPPVWAPASPPPSTTP